MLVSLRCGLGVRGSPLQVEGAKPLMSLQDDRDDGCRSIWQDVGAFGRI